MAQKRVRLSPHPHPEMLRPRKLFMVLPFGLPLPLGAPTLAGELQAVPGPTASSWGRQGRGSQPLGPSMGQALIPHQGLQDEEL